MRNKFFKKRNKAFTLIELLVVIAIISILAVVVILNIAGAQKKARDAKRMDDLKSISSALELYYSYEQVYPSTQLPDEPCDTSINGRWCATATFSDNDGEGNSSGYYTRPGYQSTQWIRGLVCKDYDDSFNPCTPANYIASLPIDPLNISTGNLETTDGDYYYAYRVNNDASGYKLIAKLEVLTDEAGNDGGTEDTLYEVFNAGGRDITH